MHDPKPQNLIIFCSDEHARRVTRCYGDPVVKTPTLDTIARLGVRFDNAYTPSPICVPARASLHTGLQVHETRCWSSAEPYYGQQESWAHGLRDAGHPVVSIGKLHFRRGGDDHGFDEEIEPMYLANEGKGWVKGLLRDPLPPYDDTAELAEEIGPGETSYTEYDRRVTHEAIKWLKTYPRKFTRKPWVLFVSFISPHYPLKCPEEYYRLYERQKLPEPPRQRPEHEVLEEIRSHLEEAVAAARAQGLDEGAALSEAAARFGVEEVGVELQQVHAGWGTADAVIAAGLPVVCALVLRWLVFAPDGTALGWPQLLTRPTFCVIAAAALLVPLLKSGRWRYALMTWAFFWVITIIFSTWPALRW